MTDEHDAESENQNTQTPPSVRSPAHFPRYPITIQHPVPRQSNTIVTYDERAGRLTGVMQLFLGVASAVISIGHLVITSFSAISFGLWGGTLIFIPSGLFGFFSHGKKPFWVHGYFIMCMLSLISTSTLTFAAIYTATGEYSSSHDGVDLACHILLSIVGTGEFLAAGRGLICCARAVCCEGGATPMISHQTLDPHSPDAVLVTTPPPVWSPRVPDIAESIPVPPDPPPPYSAEPYDWQTAAPNPPEVAINDREMLVLS